MVKDLTRGDPKKVILTFAAAVFLGNLCQYFYNMADSLIVGRALGTGALAAVGATASVSNFIIGASSGVAAGFGVVVGQLFGAGEERKMRKAIANLIYASVIFLIVVTSLSVVYVRDILILMRTPEDILGEATEYLRVLLYGMCFTMFYNILASVLRAVGDSRTPLAALLLSTVLNIGLDVLFVVVLPFGVAGAAAATVLAQLISALVCLIYVIVKMPFLRLKKDEWSPDGGLFLRLLRVGFPMGLYPTVNALGGILLQVAINGHGTDIVASVTAGRTVQTVFYLFFDAVAVTMSNFCAQNAGARKSDRIRTGIRDGLVINLILAVFSTAMLWFFGEPMAMIFAEDGAALSAAGYYLRIQAVFMIPLGTLYIFRFAAQGLGLTFSAVIDAGVEMAVRVVVALFFSQDLFLVFAACPLGWIPANVFLIIVLLVDLRRREKRWGTGDEQKEAGSAGEEKKTAL